MAALLVRSCSSAADQSSRGARSRKKNGGPKKAPQRGMGVAQLERELERIERTQRPENHHHGLLVHPNSFMDHRHLHQNRASSAMHALGLMVKPSGFIGFHPMWPSKPVQDESSHLLMKQAAASSNISPDFRANVDMVFVKHDLNKLRGLDDYHHHHPRPECRELSLLNPSIPKELSSFQTKYPGNNNSIAWPTLPKVASVNIQKRPPYYLQQQQEFPPVLGSPSRGESSPSSTTTDEQQHKGAHYTPRSISCALGKSSSSSQQQLMKNNAKRNCPSYEELPAPKRFAGGDGGHFLSLGLTMSQYEDSECASFTSDDKSLSMQETVTSVDESNPRSPSYGSSMDHHHNKSEEIDLSLKL